MARSSKRWLRPLIGLPVMLSMSACSNEEDTGGGGGGTGGGGDASKAVSCPYDEYSQVFTPEDPWTASVTDVCTTPEGSHVLLVNTSPVLLDITAAAGSTLYDSGYPEPASFADAVNQQVVSSTPIEAGRALVPPSGWVVATGNPASVLVGLPIDAAAMTYAADKLVGYVESKLTNPSRAMAERVVDCLGEAGQTLSNSQNANIELDFLLADAALGVGTSCGSLIAAVASETGEPKPQVAVLETEFGRFKSSMKASVVDDLLGLARNALKVL